jgi:sugar phosphate isomerase/epimerase
MAVYLTCSTICFRNQPLDVMLAEIRRAGFLGLDFALVPGFCYPFDALGAGPDERQEFVARVLAAGFVLPTLTVVPGSFNARDADADAIVRNATVFLDLALQLGIRAVNINCGRPIGDRSRFREHAALQAEGLKRIARRAALSGLTLNVEAPHRNGLCRTLDEACFLLDAIAEDNVRFLLDTTHVLAGGAAPSDAVTRFGARLGCVHLRDGRGENIFLVPGDGEIDFRGFLATLEAAGYAGPCALELEGHGETLAERRAGLARALRFLLTQASSFSGLAGAPTSTRPATEDAHCEPVGPGPEGERRP